MASSTSPDTTKSRFSRFLLFLVLVLAPLAVLFGRALLPDYVVFSNDGPFGGMVAELNRMPGILTGIWADLNWFGGAYPQPFPDASTALRLVTSPLYYAKLFAPFSLFCAAFGAWVCFRQHKFSPIACLVVAVAAALNSDFVNTSAWGVCSQSVAFGMNFLALAALADTTSPRRWLRVVLAGCAVGLGVSEAYDIGALFSLFVAAFVVVQSLVEDGSVGKRIVAAASRLALVGICAGLVAAAALATLIGTQIKGVAGVEQDADSKAARWSFATQYSIPKREALGIIVPGLFGFRFDTPDGGEYWGRAGSDPSWDEFVASGGQRGRPGGAFRAGAGSNYAGLLVIVLAMFGVAQSFRKQGSPFTNTQRRLIWFWLGAMLVALALMFGRFAPFYQFFYALPYVSTIRNPAKFLHVAEWCLLILCAYGAEALCRQGLAGAAKAGEGLAAHWKTFWARARGFDRRWVQLSGLAVGVFALVWLIYAGARPQLEKHLMELTRLQYLAQGATPDQAARGAETTADSARAIAKYSVGQVGRTMIFLVPTIALVALVLSGYFAGRRAVLAGALLLGLLIADLLPVNRHWIRTPNWKLKYETNPVIEFLREKPYEHRVAIVPVNQGMFSSWYGAEWTQHLFPYYNIQTLDIVQEPRVGQDKAAYEAALSGSLLRRWELSNTRYLFAPTNALGALNQQLDPGRSRFRIALKFDPVAKPGTAGQSIEEITTAVHANGQMALYDFTGALPRAKLYARWKTTTNDLAAAQNWLTNLIANFEARPPGQRPPREWTTALLAQNPIDLATLKELSDPTFDPAQTVLLAEPLPVAPGTNENAGEVKFESYAPKHIVLSAKATAPCVLLLNDKFDPNWNVTVDGQPAKLLRANFIVRAVFLDKPGEHRIEFKFQPPLTGLYISTAAVVVGLGLLGFLIFAERKSASPT